MRGKVAKTLRRIAKATESRAPAVMAYAERPTESGKFIKTPLTMEHPDGSFRRNLRQGKKMLKEAGNA